MRISEKDVSTYTLLCTQIYSLDGHRRVSNWQLHILTSYDRSLNAVDRVEAHHLDMV